MLPVVGLLVFAPNGGWLFWLRWAGIAWCAGGAVFYAEHATHEVGQRGPMWWLRSAGMLGLVAMLYWIPNARVALLPMLVAGACLAKAREIDRLTTTA